MRSNSSYAINHCGLRNAILDAGMSRADFTEAVMKRTGEIVSDAQTGKQSAAHKFGGVELCAQSVARVVIDEGARQVAQDLDVDLERLKNLATSAHISGC
jgi:hypothetical protein